jgi:hypothetical protein
MALRFEPESAPEPNLPHNWDERARAFGRGLTVIQTAQCPYFEKGVRDILASGKEKGVRTKSVEFKTAQEVREQSPSAYSISGLVLDGKLLSHQNLSLKNLEKILLERNKGK